MFAAGFLAVLMAGGLPRAEAVSKTPMDRITHAHACRPLKGSQGSAQYVAGAISNVSSTHSLVVSCPLTSPPGGFDDYAYAGASVSDASWNGDVLVRTCWTAREFTATGCASSNWSYSTGAQTIMVPLYDRGAPFESAYSVQVTLPPTFEGSTSQVMAYGHSHDTSGYASSSDVGYLYSVGGMLSQTIGEQSSALDQLESSIADLDSRVTTLENDNNVN